MNEMLTLLMAAVATAGILVCLKLGKSRLHGLILVFLILITAVGGKVVSLFGLDANSGNIFYAATCLAIYFLIERYGRRAGLQAIYIGVIGVVFFVLSESLVILRAGSPETAILNAALATSFAPIPRIALASMTAFVVGQYTNVYFYSYLKERSNGVGKWWRANVANAVTQIVDSVIFFPMAFGGVVLHSHVVELVFSGLAIKILYMIVAGPLLYFNDLESEEDTDGRTTVVTT